MSKSIAIFGAGPGLGRSVAGRYGADGYDVVLIARRREPLERLARELTDRGVVAHVVTADLSQTGTVAALAEEIRAVVGDLDVLYYGPTAGGARPATALTPIEAQTAMPIAFYSLVALVQEFLPAMVARQRGAILSATGASAMQGMANFSGPGPALAAQRNYLQSLEAELIDAGVYVGRLSIGAPIAGSAWHARLEAANDPVRTRPRAVDPDELAEAFWAMHNTTKQPERTYPPALFARDS